MQRSSPRQWTSRYHGSTQRQTHRRRPLSSWKTENGIRPERGGRSLMLGGISEPSLSHATHRRSRRDPSGRSRKCFTPEDVPLAWAHAEFIKLLISRHLGYPVDRPEAVWQRYGGRHSAAKRAVAVVYLPAGSVFIPASLPLPRDLTASCSSSVALGAC
jgi:hypothetical protein